MRYNWFLVWSGRSFTKDGTPAWGRKVFMFPEYVKLAVKAFVWLSVLLVFVGLAIAIAIFVYSMNEGFDKIDYRSGIAFFCVLSPGLMVAGMAMLYYVMTSGLAKD